MSPAWILALLVGLYLVIARSIAVLDPKLERKIWKNFARRPKYSIERMGFVLIALALVMIYFAAYEYVTFPAAVILITAGWLLCMGCLSVEVKPATSMSLFFARKSSTWIRLTSLLFVVLGIAVIYIVLILE